MHHRSIPRRPGGFTLIELMIVIAIIGILAAIALPQFNDYLRKARISDATSQLSSGKTAMEQWFADRRTYTGALVWDMNNSGGVLATGQDECSRAMPFPNAISQYFTFECQDYDGAAAPAINTGTVPAGTDPTAASGGFLLLARGQGSMAGSVYAIDHLGRRWTNVAGAAGWNTGGVLPCWKTSRGNTC